MTWADSGGPSWGAHAGEWHCVGGEEGFTSARLSPQVSGIKTLYEAKMSKQKGNRKLEQRHRLEKLLLKDYRLNSGKFKICVFHEPLGSLLLCHFLLGWVQFFS